MLILDCESGERFDVPEDTLTLDMPDDPPMMGNEVTVKDGRATYAVASGITVKGDPTLGTASIGSRRKGSYCLVLDEAQNVFWRSKLLER